MEPQICLQRVGLYAEVIVFDDIVGHILAKSSHIPREYWHVVSRQVQEAIGVLTALREWVKVGIVKILPSDAVLSRMHQDARFPMLNAVSSVQASGDLPEVIMKILSSEQRKALSTSAGHTLIYKANKAFLLKEQLDFTLSADDTFYDIVCETLKWNRSELGDISNIYLLKKIRTQYLCNSADLVFELRKRGDLSSMRRFFREQIEEFFGDDIRVRSNQASIDGFSRALRDRIEEANAELAVLKRKFGSEVITNLALGGASMLLALTIDFGANFASWIPKLIGSVPAVHAGENILEAIKGYIVESTEIKTKPTFILGSQMEKEL